MMYLEWVRPRSRVCHDPPPMAALHHTAQARTAAPPVSPAAHDTVNVEDVASAICTEGALGGTAGRKVWE